LASVLSLAGTRPSWDVPSARRPSPCSLTSSRRGRGSAGSTLGPAPGASHGSSRHEARRWLPPSTTPCCSRWRPPREPTFTTVEADIGDLPFEDASFDGATLRHRARVRLRSGGGARRAGACALRRCAARRRGDAAGSLWGVGHRLRGWRSGGGSGYAQGAFVRPEEIDRLLAAAGLVPEGDWRGAIWWPPLGGPVSRLRRPIDAAGGRLAPARAAFMARRARRSARATLA